MNKCKRHDWKDVITEEMETFVRGEFRRVKIRRCGVCRRTQIAAAMRRYRKRKWLLENVGQIDWIHSQGDV